MSSTKKTRFFYHIVLFTDVPGWEDVLEVLDEPSAEIWYHTHGIVPHYHVVAHSDKHADVGTVRKALGFFKGAHVQRIENTESYRRYLASARSEGERYVGK